MSTESILPAYWGYSAMDKIHLKDIHRKFGQRKLRKYPTFGLFDKLVLYPKLYNFQVHRPLELIDYRKDDAKKKLIDEFGWRDYGGKHYESKFTQFTQAYYLPEKFGFDKRKAHLSSLIVSGQITREEALEEVKKPTYDPVQLEKDHEYFIKKLGFSADEWKAIMASPPKTGHDYKNKIKMLARIERALWLWKAMLRVLENPSRLKKLFRTTSAK